MKDRRLARSLIGSGLMLLAAGLVGLIAVSGGSIPAVVFGVVMLVAGTFRLSQASLCC